MQQQHFSYSSQSFDAFVVPGIATDVEPVPTRREGELSPAARLAVLATATVLGWAFFYLCWQVIGALIG